MKTTPCGPATRRWPCRRPSAATAAPGTRPPGVCLRLLGDIAARREPPECDQAGDYYRQALTLAEELGMRPLMAHCHLGLGKLYATVGRRAEARAVLAAVIELYRAMEMTFWLPQAEAVLAEMEG